MLLVATLAGSSEKIIVIGFACQKRTEFFNDDSTANDFLWTRQPHECHPEESLH
jgi:hypothetical protein